MAIFSEIICDDCGQKVSVDHPASECPPDICGECQKKANDTKRKLYLYELKKLSLEERIAKIESALYDYENDSGRYSVEDLRMG